MRYNNPGDASPMYLRYLDHRSSRNCDLTRAEVIKGHKNPGDTFVYLYLQRRLDASEVRLTSREKTEKEMRCVLSRNSRKSPAKYRADSRVPRLDPALIFRSHSRYIASRLVYEKAHGFLNIFQLKSQSFVTLELPPLHLPAAPSSRSRPLTFGFAFRQRRKGRKKRERERERETLHSFFNP